MRLHTKLLLALASGTAFGTLANVLEADWLRSSLIALEPIGTAFIRLITMVVVPLVIGSLFVATASVGHLRRLAGIGGRTLGYFLTTTIIATTIGLTLALMVQPGVGLDPAISESLTAQFESNAASATAAAEGAPRLIDILVEMIPRNPFESAARMDLLPLIVATIIFGAASSAVPEKQRELVIGFFKGVNAMSMVVIKWVMPLAPYAVFVLIGATVSRFGLELLERLLVYCIVVIAGLALHVVGVFSLILRMLARVELRAFYRRVAEASLLAFSTASSAATLPVSMKVAIKNLGISDQVTSFVLPLGATMNMNGSALYKGVTAVFVAQVYGLSLGAGEILTIIVTGTLAAVAGVGIPGSSLVTTLIVLNAIGLGPQAAAGIALVVGVDRLLDMFRTGVNVTGDLVGAALVARVEARERR